jgi:mycothiol system anti-sigma-R factor
MTNVDDQEPEKRTGGGSSSATSGSPPLGGAALGALSCNPTLQQLYDFLDGRLDETEKSLLQSHFKMCTGCDDVFHFHAQLRTMIGVRCREEMPADVRQRLLDSITKLF